MRLCTGELKVWKLVHVPSVAEEDQRQLHRELIKLKAERTSVSNSIKGLLTGLGLNAIVDDHLPVQLERLRQWDGAKLPSSLHQRQLREFARWQLISRQLDELERERSAKIRDDKHPRSRRCGGSWISRGSARAVPGCWGTSGRSSVKCTCAASRARNGTFANGRPLVFQAAIPDSYPLRAACSPACVVDSVTGVRPSGLPGSSRPCIRAPHRPFAHSDSRQP
jgi:hypothetical protein